MHIPGFFLDLLHPQNNIKKVNKATGRPKTRPIIAPKDHVRCLKDSCWMGTLDGLVDEWNGGGADVSEVDILTVDGETVDGEIVGMGI